MTAERALPPFRPPYAFAKAHGLVLAVDVSAPAGAATVFVRSGGDGAALTGLDELRRILGCPLHPVLCNAPQFEQHLAAAYSRADQTAAEVADDIGQEMDLTVWYRNCPPSRTCWKAKMMRPSSA